VRKALNETGDGAVIGFLYLRREATSGKFSTFQVMGQAFTAPALSGAWLIGTGASPSSSFNIAFHRLISPSERIVYQGG
jgi:hypothetical protein